MSENPLGMVDYGAFSDAWSLSDEMWSFIDPENATTAQELHFLRVLWFHFDFENGGLNQVMYNKKSYIAECIQSFREIGLGCLADVVQIAQRQVVVGTSWRSVFNRPPAEMDHLYRAIAYGNPFDSPYRDEKFEEFAPPIIDNFYQSTDWVVRTALKYARDNFENIPELRAAFDS